MRRAISSVLLVLSVVSSPNQSVTADDWPMWRYDAARSGASPTALPEQLHLSWTRELPQPRPAWPSSQTKLQFDAVHQPIVVGSNIIVGSTVDDSVVAYSTKTGDEAWRFITDGPVRFAPAAFKGRVYAASDDGYLYCLDAVTGSLLWKFNGGPSDRRIIGNDRLISSWPIRGGPVIKDGVVYFTASIWPFMGVFVHAVNAETGETVWVNSETGSRWITHPHGAPSFGSIVPQGYLAAAGDNLVVPGGRSLPAVFDRRNGQLRHFNFGGKGSGGWSVVAHENSYLISGNVLSMDNGKVIGSSSASVLKSNLLIDKMNAQSIDPSSLQTVDGVDRRGNKVTRFELKANEAFAIGSSDWTVHVMAGHRVYASRRNSIASFDVDAAQKERKPQQPVWSAEINGDVVSVLAGDDKLFVVTRDAKLYCFSKVAGQAKTHALSVKSDRSLDSESDQAKLGKHILDTCGETDGYAIALGIGSGQLIDEILAASKFHVIVLDQDAKAVDRFRRRLSAVGMYGRRVVAHEGRISSYNLPPYLANLVFSEDIESAGIDEPADFAGAVFRSLRPYDGLAALPLSESQHDALDKAMPGRQEKRADLTRVGELTLLGRRGSLPDSGSWTHQYADAGNSVVSQDQLVKAPLGLLWFGGASNDKVLPRHGHGPSPQVAGGRLVIEGADMLRCVDVYTGRVLWEKDLPGLGEYYNTTSHFAGAGEIGSNYVTLPNAVYAVYGAQILELDPGTGRTRREFTLDKTEQNAAPGWGFIAATDDLLVATSSPVAVGTRTTAKPKQAKGALPKDLTPIIKPAAEWNYLAGADPTDEWTSIDFSSVQDWKAGSAGFGYGDGDDKTVLSKMKGSYQRIYLRREFDSKDVSSASKLVLAVNYDDAFIAYLNGKEVLRVGVGKGQGAKASNIASHEAGGFETFEISDFRKLVHAGKNVIAIEGHNTGLTSSDFSLDPCLLIKADGKSGSPTEKTLPKTESVKLLEVVRPVKYSSASRQLVVFERESGKMLWKRTAEFSFRHNCIALGDGNVFCIDSMTDAKRQELRRRGVEPKSKPRLLALDAKTGDELWSTEENVFGTFLNYSSEHGILLQAGSQYRDRAKDEVGQGMVAYRGDDGSVLWQDLSRSHGGPCLLWKDKIITNGGGGSMFELLTGAMVDWKYSRMYGCNTAVGSQNLLTFRSGAAGFCDMAGDSGTGNIGGFRSSCTANLIVADGVLSAPDYTRTCSCAYQNQTSLALIHMPEAEMWTFSSIKSPPQQFGLNLGAPGDRRAPSGAMWYDFPSVGGSSPSLAVAINGNDLRYVRRHSSAIKGGSQGHLPWITSSCVLGVSSIKQELADSSKEVPRSYTVKLHFAELEGLGKGERVFDVSINGKVVLPNLDIASEVGGDNLGLVKQLTGVKASGEIEVTFTARTGVPCISGIEVMAE